MLKNSEKKLKKCWNAKETRWTLEVVIQKIWVKGFASKQYTDQKKNLRSRNQGALHRKERGEQREEKGVWETKTGGRE